MKRILNKRIVKALRKEESDTKKRYTALGKKYHIKALVKAGKDEGRHAKLFKRLSKRQWQYPQSPEYHLQQDYGY